MKRRSDTENQLTAYDWLCRSRIQAGHNADIRDQRLHWPVEQKALFRQVDAGTYPLSPMRIIRTATPGSYWRNGQPGMHRPFNEQICR